MHLMLWLGPVMCDSSPLSSQVGEYCAVGHESMVMLATLPCSPYEMLSQCCYCVLLFGAIYYWFRHLTSILPYDNFYDLSAVHLDAIFIIVTLIMLNLFRNHEKCSCVSSHFLIPETSFDIVPHCQYLDCCWPGDGHKNSHLVLLK